MPHVTVNINGRQFRLACEDGEETHLARLAAELDTRIEALRVRHGEIGDARLTVMAALMIADELSDSVGKVRKLEGEFAALDDVRGAAADFSKATQDAVAAALNSAAERIENITRRLNQTVADAGVAMG
jgi:cell division protein ZapA